KGVFPSSSNSLRKYSRAAQSPWWRTVCWKALIKCTASTTGASIRQESSRLSRGRWSPARTISRSPSRGGADTQPTRIMPSIRSSSLLNRSEEHTSELQSRFDLVCRLLLEKKTNISENKEQVALVKDEIVSSDPVVTRVYSEFLTGAAFRSYRRESGNQLQEALCRIREERS